MFVAGLFSDTVGGVQQRRLLAARFAESTRLRGNARRHVQDGIAERRR